MRKTKRLILWSQKYGLGIPTVFSKYSHLCLQHRDRRTRRNYVGSWRCL